MNAPAYDAVVIGAGPNGLAAAITLAQRGLHVLVREANQTVGGSVRTIDGEGFTLPGFRHDICSTIQAMTRVSPFLRSLPLREHGLELIDPPAPFAHPLDDGTAAICERDLDATADALGADGPAYRKAFASYVRDWEDLSAELLSPLRVPRHPLMMARFGLNGIFSAMRFCDGHFKTPHARALFGGAAGHAIVPFDKTATAAFGMVLTLCAHTGGWPIARGGSQNLSNALASIFRSLGGEIITGEPVRSLSELPSSRVILADIAPRNLSRIAGDRLPQGYRRKLERFRHGPGAFKLDYALGGPIPWTAKGCARAGTVHLGGTLEELAAAERASWEGRNPEKPFVLVVQPTLFDPSRAPAGKHVAWAYCHVPNGSTFDMTERIENQIERFAPGFRDLILARHVMPPASLEQYNANLVGGDVNGGAQDISQLFTRPFFRPNFDPYSTPSPGLFLCSASTPPGGAVHGMCGYYAGMRALASLK